MGKKFVNYQILSSSMSAVAHVVKETTRKKAYVSPSENRWITVYDQMSDYEVDYNEIAYLAKSISSSLSTVVFAFTVRSGLNFMYLLYDCGQLMDEFCDDPEAFGFEYGDKATLLRFNGKPEILLKYCLPNVKLQAVARVLDSSKSGDVEQVGQEAVYQLSLLLGIDGYRAISGYSYFEDNSLHNSIDPSIEDANRFLLIQR